MKNKIQKVIPVLRFSEFSSNWCKKQISDVALKVTDGTHDTPKPIVQGVPYITAIHVKDGNIDFNNCYYLPESVHHTIYRRCNPEFGDLLMVNIGAGTATCAKVNVNYEFSLKNVALIKPDRTIIDPDFLSQILRKKSKRLKHEISSGGAQPFLSLKQIGKLKLCIPSLPEQQKIASFLTAVDDKINALKRKHELLTEYKRGVMQKIFSQEIRFKDENGETYPDWEEKKLGEVVNITMGQSPSSNSYNNDSKGLPLIQGNADLKNRKTSPQRYTTEPTKICKVGDIIMSVRAPVGEIANSYHEACIGRGVCAISTKQGTSKKFIFQWLLEFEPIWRRISQGSTFSAISRSDIQSLKIYMPLLEEQEKIAEFLTTIDTKLSKVEQQFDQMETFKKGLLQQMFV